MNYWYVWPIGIAIWVVLGLVAFAFFEKNALRHDARKDEITLSMFLYTVGKSFPLSILLAGLIIGTFGGGLGVHLLWHWCPPGSVSIGELKMTNTGELTWQDLQSLPVQLSRLSSAV